MYLWAKNWEKTDLPKIDIEPVPVMEITKPTGCCNDAGSESQRHHAEIKTEAKPFIKDEQQDEKSIASDSELMKILEEDSTHSDESKKEDLTNSQDSHILLDALTSGGSDAKEKKDAQDAASDVKTESTGAMILHKTATLQLKKKKRDCVCSL